MRSEIRLNPLEHSYGFKTDSAFLVNNLKQGRHDIRLPRASWRSMMLWAILLLKPFISNAQYAPYEEKGKFGIKDQVGVVVVPPLHQRIGWSDGTFSVRQKMIGYQVGSLWGLMDINHNKITDPLYLQLVPKAGVFVARKTVSKIKNQAGVIGRRGEPIVPFEYDGIEVKDSLVIVYHIRHGRYNVGMMNLNGRALITALYADIDTLAKCVMVKNHRQRKAIYSRAGKPLTRFEYDSIRTMGNYILLYRSDGVGMMDAHGNILLPPKYADIQSDVSSSKGRVKLLEQNKWVLLDSKNKQQGVIEAEVVLPMGKDLLISRFDKWGVFNNSLEEVLPIKYDSLMKCGSSWLVWERDIWKSDSQDESSLLKSVYDSVFTTGDVSYLKKGASWGALFHQDDAYIHCVYDFIGERRGDYILVRFHGQYGMIDVHENWICPPQTLPLKWVTDSIVALQGARYTTLMNTKGRKFFFSTNELIFGETNFVENLDFESRKFDYQGNLINRTQNQHQWVGTTTENMQGFYYDGKYGFEDERGRIRIANRYDSIKRFNEGCAAIKINSKWGFINTNDQLIVQPIYDHVSQMANHCAIVWKDQQCGLVDQVGNQILKIQYQNITRQSNGFLKLSINQKQGLANPQGMILLQVLYDEIRQVSDDYVIVQNNGKYGVMTKDGVPVIPMSYDLLHYYAPQKNFVGLLKGEWMIYNK